MSQSCEVKVRFSPPPQELRRYFTTFYFAEWIVPAGGQIADYLLPEWANLRFYDGDWPEARTLSGISAGATSFPATGPSSETIRFAVGSSRMWGIGLLPLGWAKYIRAPAAEFANKIVDGNTHPAMAGFAPLARTLFGKQPDPKAELARITRHFLDSSDGEVPDEARIAAIHGALIDPDVASVTDLVARAGVSQRTVERICHRHFGFPPKLLLRRQRFMRSLSHFIMDPTLKWIGAMDGHYHDQAQFVRDFRQFMGMSPRQYAALDKPLMDAVAKERSRLGRAPVQTLDSPDGTAIPG